MRRLHAIWRREMTACFLSPVAYVTLVAYLGATAFTFWFASLHNEGRPEPLAILLVGSVMFWMPILVTVVSMRLFVDEKRLGTIETLLTAPVSEREIVLGKYLGALTFLVLAMAPTVSFVFIVERISPGITLENLDMGALLGGGIIALLVTSAFLAVALVASLTTRNQIVAAICTFCALWLFLLVGWLLRETPGIPVGLADALSVTGHIESFAHGVIAVRPIVLYVTTVLFLLFTATRMLESQRWR